MFIDELPLRTLSDYQRDRLASAVALFSIATRAAVLNEVETVADCLRTLERAGVRVEIGPVQSPPGGGADGVAVVLDELAAYGCYIVRDTERGGVKLVGPWDVPSGDLVGRCAAHWPEIKRRLTGDK